MRKNRFVPPMALIWAPHAGDREIRMGAFGPAHIHRQEGRDNHVTDAGCKSV